ncbi:MAG: TonB-dependent receptor plug domain-containing protein, partial [Phenylobacterium sp.]|nr:TonB-dependent receptor plug domain-containing protein [Phenylobacterium sp.]
MAQAGAPPIMIEELVVTAEKREASLQDVPVAMTAYTSEKRDLLGVATVEDLARMTPSLSYTNNDRLAIRGFGRLTNAIGTDPSVALYSDGIFSNSMADSSTPSLFIERTEILRGPQGTLYGRNSIGGALNIISKRPTEDFNAEVRATLGNYGVWRTDA